MQKSLETDATGAKIRLPPPDEVLSAEIRALRARASDLSADASPSARHAASFLRQLLKDREAKLRTPRTKLRS